VDAHKWGVPPSRKGAHTDKGVCISREEGCGGELGMIWKGKLRRIWTKGGIWIGGEGTGGGVHRNRGGAYE
jgi:hypothetical protein